MRNIRVVTPWIRLVVLCLGLVVSPAVAADPATPLNDYQAYQQAVDRAISYLSTKAQAPDGSYAAYAGPGVTAVVTTGVLANGRGPNDPVVAKSLKYLEGFVQPDGGIYQKDTLYRNYETSLMVLCFSAANRGGRYDKLLKGAEKYLKQEQWDESEGKSIDDPAYGGAGYGKHQRPDLSNTQFLVEALHTLGDGPNDEAIKKALIFVSRSQNLETEHNTTGLAAKNPDGGFYYTPIGQGESMAGKLPNGGLRSYGSMTYAGLKSMIYAGVGPEDPRVKAAFAWIQKYYDVKANPGMGETGLYYYYHTFAKALDAMKVDQIEGPDGVKHDWRRELREELLRRQQPDGSWVNQNKRWLEGDPALVTGYALLSLTYCRPTAKAEK
jgi:squalene-hopene/tetraprenyl-beta-curcumene cyclase